jgi:hypothetical protein
LFIIGAWLTITPPEFAQYSDTTSVILIEFSKPMSIDSLLYEGNYMVLYADTTEHKIFRIYKVGIVTELDSIQIADTTLVCLITEKLPYRKSYYVGAKNIGDREGNLINENKYVWFFFNGYVPNKYGSPVVNFRESK